jgi:hypothetical protein
MTGGQLLLRSAHSFDVDGQSLVMHFSDKELASPQEKQYLGLSLSDSVLSQQLKDYLNTMGKFDVLDDFILRIGGFTPLLAHFKLGAVVELFSDLEEEYGAETKFKLVSYSVPRQAGNEEGLEAMKTANWVKFTKDNAQG